MKGKHDIDKKILNVGIEKCFISEISIAELKYGAEKSAKPDINLGKIKELENTLKVITIKACIDLYAKEKARLELLGNRLDDFDLLIGTTAVKNNFIIVTQNVKHFERIDDIMIEDWTK